MSELKRAIDQISKDRGIDRDLLIDTLEEAVRSAVARKYGETMDIEVAFNEELGEIEVFEFKVVVEEVHDPVSEISPSKTPWPTIPTPSWTTKWASRSRSRISAALPRRSAKQVIIQRMRDAEQEIIYEEYKDRVSEIASGIIQRRDRTGWIINLGRTEALLPKEEQIPQRALQARRPGAGIYHRCIEGIARTAGHRVPVPPGLHDRAVQARGSRSRGQHGQDHGRGSRSGPARQGGRYVPRPRRGSRSAPAWASAVPASRTWSRSSRASASTSLSGPRTSPCMRSTPCPRP